MVRFGRTLLFLLLAALCLSAVAQGKNLVRNPGFEELDASGWIKEWGKWLPSTPPPEIVIDRNAHSGERAVCLRGKEVVRGKVDQRIKVQGGHGYKVSAWVRTQDISAPGEAAVLRLQWLASKTWDIISTTERTVRETSDNVRVGLSDGNLYFWLSSQAGNWEEMSAVVVAPENAKYVALELFIWNSKGSIWWDDVQIVDLGELEFEQLVTQIPQGPLEPVVGEHPYLFFRGSDLEQLKDKTASGKTAVMWQQILRNSEGLLNITPLQLRSNPENFLQLPWSSNLGISRQAQSRILTLSLTYLLTEEERFAQRAWQEIEAVMDWYSWVDPCHLPLNADLMTGTTAMALGVAYDWLYDYLSDQQKALIREALRTKAFIPYLQDVEEGAWWTRAYHNWNTVVNGGVGVGALAVYDEEPMARLIVDQVRKLIEPFFRAIGQDGGWDEGTGYWSYGMNYATYFLSALQTALGTDDGKFSLENVQKTGLFPIYLTASDGAAVNFGDAGTSVPSTPLLYRLAEEAGEPAYAWFQSKWTNPDSRYSLFDFLWYPVQMEEKLANFKISDLPLGKHFRGIQWAVARGSWNDDEALYLAFKSGDTAANHSQLDLNSFIFVAHGERYLIDPGAGTYSKEYFSGDRWENYRASTSGHNTILVNGKGQIYRSKGEITTFESNNDFTYLIGDASRAYSDLQLFRRHVLMVDNRYVLLLDEVEAEKPFQIDWLLHTRCDVEKKTDGLALIGSHGELQILLLEPEQYKVTVEEPEDKLITVTPSGKKQKMIIAAILCPLDYRFWDQPLQVEKDSSDNSLVLNVKSVEGYEERIEFIFRDGRWQLADFQRNGV